MLKTMSGRAKESFCGKNSSASRRTTLPKTLRACSTAFIVEGSSHSAYASEEVQGSGFSLYARPIRIGSRVPSYKKGRLGVRSEKVLTRCRCTRIRNAERMRKREKRKNDDVKNVVGKNDVGLNLVIDHA